MATTPTPRDPKLESYDGKDKWLNLFGTVCGAIGVTTDTDNIWLTVDDVKLLALLLSQHLFTFVDKNNE